MESKYAMSLCIRDYELSLPQFHHLHFGYDDGHGIRENYLSNDSFASFIASFSDKHRSQYNNADGGELEQKFSNRWNRIMPPKMAAFASSSRMIYNLAKDVSDFGFEQPMRTNLGGNPANLDGYLKDGSDYYFIEAKRSEIFDSHPNVREIYRDEIYRKITDSQLTPLSIECGEMNSKGEFHAVFKYAETELKYFDIKQMISHMLGISYEFLDSVDFTLDKGGRVVFLYLLYDPNEAVEFELRNSIAGISKSNADAIVNRHSAVVDEISTVDMTSLFKAVAEIQAKRCGKHESDRYECLKSAFEFHLCSQYDFLTKLK